MGFRISKLALSENLSKETSQSWVDTLAIFRRNVRANPINGTFVNIGRKPDFAIPSLAINTPTFDGVLSDDVDSIIINFGPYQSNNGLVRQTHLEVQISRDEQFNDLIVNEKIFPVSSKRYSGFNWGEVKHIRVRYYSGNVVSEWSEVYEKDIKNPAINRPILNASLVEDTSIGLTSSNFVANSDLLTFDEMLIEVSEDSNFSNILRQVSANTFNFKLDDFEPETTYFLRVKHLGSGYESEWSNVRKIEVPGAGLEGIGPFTWNGETYYVAPASTRVIRQWKTSQTSTTDTTNFSDGRSNTDSMNNTAHPAAHYARSLGPEWFLPAREELGNVVYQNREAIDAADTTSGTKLSDIANGPYDASNGWQRAWSSTETTSRLAWLQKFSGGDIGFNSKDSGYWVIAVRKV